MKIKNILLAGFLGLYLSCAVQAGNLEFMPPGQFDFRPVKNWDNLAVTYDKGMSDIDLFVTLDQQQYPYLQSLIQQYARDKGLHIKVDDGTCGVSAGLLRRKAVDIGGFCCPPGRLDRLAGLEFHTLGIMSLAIIANPSVPVDNLTLEQARKIFRGEITDWRDLTAQSEENAIAITPVIRPHCKKRPGHWRLIVPTDKQFSHSGIKVGAIQDMLQYVADKEYAIGYETLWMLKRFGRGLNIKVLTIDGMHPDDMKTLAENRYPLYRTYNITTWNDAAAKKAANELVQWIKKQISSHDEYRIVNAAELRQQGWRFDRDEVVASPSDDALISQRQSRQ